MRHSARILAAFALSACTTPRYLGSVNDGTYVNRGYGLVIPMRDMTTRWWIFDPRKPHEGPGTLPATRVDDRIDLDGDGMLRLDELTARYQPPLRLLSRTSIGARIELEVEILSEPAASEATLEALFQTELRGLAATPEGALEAQEGAESLRLAFERRALVASLPRTKSGDAVRLALVDQTNLEAEQNVSRRQLVRLRLTAPRLREDLVQDFDQLLDDLLAARRAGPTSRRERW